MLKFNLKHAGPLSPEALVLTKELHIELEELYGEGKIDEFEEEINHSFIL